MTSPKKTTTAIIYKEAIEETREQNQQRRVHTMIPIPEPNRYAIPVPIPYILTEYQEKEKEERKGDER